MPELRRQNRHAEGDGITDAVGAHTMDDDVSIDELREAVEHLHGVRARKQGTSFVSASTAT
jgi:hypothetical protein